MTKLHEREPKPGDKFKLLNGSISKCAILRRTEDDQGLGECILRKYYRLSPCNKDGRG